MVSAPELRPTFELYVPVAMTAVFDAIVAHIERSGGACQGWVHEPYAELRTPHTARRWFSPRLAVHAEPSEKGVVLACRFQPEPDVWTFYLAAWVALGIGVLGMSLYCGSQYIIGSTPSIWQLGAPVAAVVAAGLYGSAFIGQRLGREQTTWLRDQLDAALAPVYPPSPTG